MLAVGSRLFFYKNIAQLLLRNFADNPHKYKANFLWRLSTNLRVFIVCEANYSYQFYYFIKNVRMIFMRDSNAPMKKEPTIYVTYFYKYCALVHICR